MENWNISKSQELYLVKSWGEGYFDISPTGTLVVKPNRNGHAVDLSELVSSMVRRGVHAPILFRFDGIIRDRILRIFGAFEKAIEETGYKGSYRGVFPVKVNQQRHVVDCIRQAGRDKGLGLEVGSKPELIAVLAMHDTPDALLLCNGYKDREYIELALTAKRLGRRCIIIVEQLHEMSLVLDIAENLGIDAEVGVRMKPVEKGSGHWESSSGDACKFGLSTTEIVLAVDELIKRGRRDWLKLLHFHIGSQIPSIQPIKRVLKEATRIFTELYKLCPSMSFIDVGGGLAVDYDGSNTNFASSMNYSLDEYARDVVDAINEACISENVPAPDIITESGRAIVAHHAVLVTEVVDVAPTLDAVTKLDDPPSQDKALELFRYFYDNVTVKNCHETLNDAVALRDEILERFVQGDLNLIERAYGDKAFWHLMTKIRNVAASMRYLPEDLEKLSEKLRDTYFCSFSVFQSLPDAWAIDQLFPVMPIQRLNEEPTRRATLADMSCDSDGKIDKFIDLKDVRSYINLHVPGETTPYYVGLFLVGAYQEILGDLHNLLGDTSVVHVQLDDAGQTHIAHIVPGDTVKQVLGYVEYDEADLDERLRLALEKSMREGKMSAEESAKIKKRFKEAMESYTYYQKY